MFIVYALYSSNYNKIYIGYTSNLVERYKSHNELSKKGWTIKYRPWIIIHQESFENKLEAILREKQLKSASGRNFIRSKIVKEH
jgi:putative endonuclease